MLDLSGLPGAEWVEQGIEDHRSGKPGTVPALLVSIAGSRLRRLGLPVPALRGQESELRLYAAIASEDPRGAYSRYNALLRRLDSFARALEAEQGRALRSRG